jgi:glucose-6-phosphate dehydrogenase assembly protein OpcA
MWFLAGLAVDAISLAWARSRLTAHFRNLVAQRYDKPE